MNIVKATQQILQQPTSDSGKVFLSMSDESGDQKCRWTAHCATNRPLQIIFPS